MQLRSLLSTYGLRITLLYAVLFAVSVSALFAVVYWATGDFMRDRLRTAIGTEMASLAHDLALTDLDNLAAVIQRRLQMPEHQGSYYLLQDPAGRRVAGNLPAMPAITGWQELPIPAEVGGEDASDKFMAQGRIESDGAFLLVGHDMDAYTDFEELILNAAGATLAAAFGLALVGGIVIHGKILRRIDVITAAGRDIMRGNLSSRIPVGRNGDEFDRLSAGLNDMLDRIQMLMDGLRQVSNDIAHDMRTPLTRLRQRLEAARVKALGVEDYQAVIDKAVAETDEILHTFGALLRIAQIEAGTRRSTFVAVDLSEALQSIVETYAAVAEDHQHSLTHRIAEDVGVRGDRRLLIQMFANLVENALRHTPPGTRIDIELKDTADGPICAIADNGPGIPEKERRKVFQRFYRLDASRATAGSGLGLSLVAAIADLHRVAVDIADNRPGVRVVLRFPKA